MTNLKKRLFIKIMIIINVFLLLIYPLKVEAANKKIVNSEKIISKDSIAESEELKDFGKYKEGEIIITYEQKNILTSLKVATNSMVNDYSIQETIEFDDVVKEKGDNQINTFSVSSNIEKSTTLAMSLVKSDKYSTKELIEIFKQKSWVISAEPNYIISTSSLTNDTYMDYQWALENNGQNAGTLNNDINPVKSSSGVEKVIAIVDTGVDYTHEDLQNVMWVNPYEENELEGTYGYDFVNQDDDPLDDMGHGTHCAGIIAAEANNEKGISGAVLGAENVKIMALKVLNENGESGDLYDAIKAYNYIYRAQQLGTNIVAINNSWGGVIPLDDEDGQEYCKSLLEAINLVGQNGALTICAAGNEGYELDENGQTSVNEIIFDEELGGLLETGNKISVQHFPAGLDSQYIITVAASNGKDEIASFSNYGEAVDVVAPGTNILSTIYSNLKYYNFVPNLLSDSEKEKYYDIYEDFEDDNLDIEYYTAKSYYDDVNPPENIQYGTLDLTSENFIGKAGKSLKWTFNYTEEDRENNVVPLLIINTKKYNYKSAVSLSISSSGPKDSNANVNVSLEYEYEKDGEIREEGGLIYAHSWDANYWTTSSINLWNNMWGTLEGTIDYDEPSFKGQYIIYAYADIPGEYTIYLDDIIITKELTDEDYYILRPYQFMDGTSMAAPFVSAAVAVSSNLYENDTVLERKDRILNATRESSKLANKVNAGILDLSNIVTPVTGITLDKTNETIKVGENLQITATVSPNNATNKNVKWESSDNSIATVSNGKVTAIKAGNVTITATTEDGGFSAKCNITIENVRQISKIEVTTKPTKTNYIQNYEQLDPTGGILTVTYNDETTDMISLTNEAIEITGFDNSKIGKNALTVKYLGETATFEVDIVSKQCIGIEVSTKPTKTNYIQNYENFDPTGGKITVTYNDTSKDTVELTNTGVEVTGFDNSKIGKNTLTVKYLGKTATFEVDIVSKQCTKIEVTTKPTKTNYIQNYENFDPTGGEITITYDDGTTDKASLKNEGVEITGFDNSKIGKNTLTVKYLGKTATFEVNIIEYNNIQIPAEKEYDKTIANIVFPNAGVKRIILMLFILIIFTIILYKNSRKYKDIK